jgi:hypothetical protein
VVLMCGCFSNCLKRDRDTRNGEGLRGLWNRFECFHENEESTRDAFLQFQTEFIRQYSDWNPEMTGFPGKGSPGHPSRVVQTVVLRYNRFVRKFETCMWSAFNEERCQVSEGVCVCVPQLSLTN